jgi:hypothetical protein
VGQSRHFDRGQATSALPPKADIADHAGYVGFVPTSDKRAAANSTCRKTASRQSLRNPIRCFDQAVILSSMTVLMRQAKATPRSTYVLKPAILNCPFSSYRRTPS